MKIALYARCSTKMQDCDGQIEELRALAKSRGWEIFREYVDSGVSGAKTSRPELDRMLQDAKSHKFDLIAVVKLDRLGRSLSHLVTLLEALQRQHVGFLSARDSIDLTTPSGKLTMHMMAAMAEFERSLIAERVKAGMRRQMAKGVKFGAKPRFDREEMLKLSETMNYSELSRHFKVSRQAIAQAFAAL